MSIRARQHQHGITVAGGVLSILLGRQPYPGLEVILQRPRFGGGITNVGPMAEAAIKVLEARGLHAGADFTRFPIQVTVDDFEMADWIVALKQAEHLPLLQERFPAWAEKVEFWHMDDGPEALALIEQEVMDLAARLIRESRRQEARIQESCNETAPPSATVVRLEKNFGKPAQPLRADDPEIALQSLRRPGPALP